MENIDITVVGAGVIGLACAARLARSSRTLVILEKNQRHGLETSSRNSEVIHAGIYYSPGGLKARLCLRGKELLYEYCALRSIPCRKCGKIITIHSSEEIPKLKALLARGRENGLSDLAWLEAGEVGRLEPGIRAFAGLLSPSTGILSADLLMDSFLAEAEANGAVFLPSSEMTAMERKGGAYEIRARSQEPFLSRIVINAAGHGAPGVAAMTGIDIERAGYRQIYMKGEYFRIRKPLKIERLIYPLPGATSLGIHLTPDLAGRIRVGPSSFEVPRLDYSVDLAHRNVFLDAARAYFPGLKEDELDPDTAGVRPRLASFPGEHPDFLIRHETEKNLPGLVNLIGMDSPGLTSAPAVAEYVEALLKDIL